MESVPDSYMFHSQIFYDPFLPFNSSLPLAVIYNSDDEEDFLHFVNTKIHQFTNSDCEIENKTGTLTLKNNDNSK